MDRAQAHSLEAFTAALLIIAGVMFALQATAVTPLSASTSSQHIENQERALAGGVLASADANGTLVPAVVYWNTSARRFVNASSAGYYANGGPPNAFGASLNDTFLSARIAFNVYVRYRGPNNLSVRQTMVYMGSPSDNAVSAAHTVFLYDDTELSGPGAGTTVSDAAAAGDFYAPDAAPTSTLFNVLEVRIVVWQM